MKTNLLHFTSTPVLGKLRVKFIALNMGLAALVLIAACITVCYLDYRNDIDEVQRALTQATEKVNSIRKTDKASDIPQLDDAAKRTEQQFVPPEIGGDPHLKRNEHLSIAIYSFEGGRALKLDNRSNASVPDDVLVKTLDAVQASSEPFGYVKESGLYFARQDNATGFVVAFADSSAATSWQSLAWGLAGVCLAALVVLFLLNLFFSRWALRPVEEAWKQQRQFMADASHELKTPLTVILANNAILRSHPNDTIAEQVQWIESTQSEAERMQGLVVDMLELSRASDENLNRTHSKTEEPVDFSRLVTGEMLQFESVAFERGITFEENVAGGMVVYGDAHKLERLVSVLLDNACKYTDAGGIVTIRLRGTDAHATLSVTNTGEPINEKDLPHLFDRFYRTDAARTRSDEDGQTPVGGYGLGLSIAAAIAQEAGGSISTISTKEEGTTFTVKLPRTA